MAGGGLLPLDLSLATAGASASAGERRRAGQRGHRRTVSALFAELGAMLPNDLLPNRVSASPCSCLLGSWQRRRRAAVAQGELFFVLFYHFPLSPLLFYVLGDSMAGDGACSRRAGRRSWTRRRSR